MLASVVVTDPIVHDPLSEARLRAQLALRSDVWSTLKAASVGFAGAVGLSLTSLSFLVLQGAMKSTTAVACFAAISVGTPIAIFLAIEFKRLHERSEALRELLQSVKQYEVLIRDARNERDEERVRAVAFEVKAAQLTSITERLLTNGRPALPPEEKE